MKRAVMRYFFLELLLVGAIQRISLPSRFSKWIDTSSSECVFTLKQRRNFKRPHLMPCPWYIELACSDSCPSEEAALRASCKQQVLIEGDTGPSVEAVEDIANDARTERERAKAASKLAKAQAKEKEREEKRLAKEQKREERKKETEERRQLGLKVKKLGLKKMLEDEGILISGSSRPTSSTPVSATPGSTYTYSIRTFDEHVSNSEVLVVNSGPDDILGAFEKLPKGAQPDAWLQISEFIRSNQGSKWRDQHGQNNGSPLVDLVIFDVPENLPVPGIIPAGEVPHWNKLKMKSKCPGRHESPWIHRAFEFASTWLQDDGAILVFFPDSKFISNEILSWADWANFQEEGKWFVSNELPLTRPDYVGRTVKYFMAKLFVRRENQAADPEDSFPRSDFTFNEHVDLLSQGIDLPNDGTICNVMPAGSLTLRSGTGLPWRGAREKSVNLLQALIGLCSEEEDIVLDLTAGTGKHVNVFRHFHIATRHEFIV